MADTVDSKTRSQIMAKVRSKDTSPERAVRRALHAAGFRFRLHRRDLPGNPDIVLPRYRVAVFVHGCFWHWHGCRRSRMPATNEDYWRAKIHRNVQRDAARREELEALGWVCRVIWECELRSGIEQVKQELEDQRRTGAGPRP